ncbi:hypothetical protein CPC08DRAFT_705222 [Agrocybe pediades]|nr:hypothetical protein CPC08DRAFT_705222 [Agrocybe pediades]
MDGQNTRAREYADRKCELEGIKCTGGLSPPSCLFAPAPTKEYISQAVQCPSLWLV